MRWGPAIPCMRNTLIENGMKLKRRRCMRYETDMLAMHAAQWTQMQCFILGVYFGIVRADAQELNWNEVGALIIAVIIIYLSLFHWECDSKRKYSRFAASIVLAALLTPRKLARIRLMNKFYRFSSCDLFAIAYGMHVVCMNDVWINYFWR